MSGAFQVQPAGSSVTVTATTSAGASAQLFYDAACTNQANGVVVTQPTTLYVTPDGTYNVSLKIGGNEQATPSGAPISVNLTGSRVVVLTPVAPTASAAVESFNTRTGEVTLELADILATELSAAEVDAVANNGDVGFFSATPAVKQTITGALSAVIDPAAKDVLTSIIAALVAYGLVTDGTT